MLKHEKPILITDLDDVICEDGYLFLLNSFLGTSYTKEDFADCYYIDSIIKDENLRKNLIRYWIKSNVYQYTNLIEGAYDTLKFLSSYLDIYICTACFYPELDAFESGLVYMQKYYYILENLSFIKPENIIFANNKNIFSGATFQIDDRIENLNNNTKYKILFPAYHNTHISKSDVREKGILKLDNWHDIKDFIVEMLN